MFSHPVSNRVVRNVMFVFPDWPEWRVILPSSATVIFFNIVRGDGGLDTGFCLCMSCRDHLHKC